MAKLKTQATDSSVAAYIDAIENESRRQDCRDLVELMGRVTGEPAVMWGSSIVGFGHCHYRYASGHEGDSCMAGFSSRKAALTLYVSGCGELDDAQLAALGKHKRGKGCLYIQRLADIDTAVLSGLIAACVASRRQPYP